MKVIQVMPNFSLAGAEIMCEHLAHELQKNGVEVVIVSFFDQRSPITQRLENLGIKIVYLHKKAGIDFSMFRKLRKVFKQEKPDVIHTHRYATAYAIPAAILAGVKKRVHTVHNVAEKETGKLGRRLNKIFFKRHGVVPVALSEKVQESIVREYHLKKESVPIVCNGVDLSRCKEKTDYRAQGEFKILHIARFMPQKNHEGLISAFEIFHKQYENSTLWLIGDGETREQMQALVQEKGLENAVEFLGLKENVHEYLAKADMFTLPSLYEGMPITLIEAMGTGLPIVATAVGGVPDMLDSESGILTQVDSEKIAEAFLTLAKDEEMRKRLGENAKVRAKAFSAEQMAKGYWRIYE